MRLPRRWIRIHSTSLNCVYRNPSNSYETLNCALSLILTGIVRIELYSLCLFSQRLSQWLSLTKAYVQSVVSVAGLLTMDLAVCFPHCIVSDRKPKVPIKNPSCRFAISCGCCLLVTIGLVSRIFGKLFVKIIRKVDVT